MRKLIFVHGYGIQLWHHPVKWHKARWFNNLYKELDFGRVSFFFGKGSHRSVTGVIYFVPNARRN